MTAAYQVTVIPIADANIAMAKNAVKTYTETASDEIVKREKLTFRVSPGGLQNQVPTNIAHSGTVMSWEVQSFEKSPGVFYEVLTSAGQESFARRRTLISEASATFSVSGGASVSGGLPPHVLAGRSLPRALLSVETRYNELVKQPSGTGEITKGAPSVLLTRTVSATEFKEMLAYFTEKRGEASIVKAVAIPGAVTNPTGAQCTNIDMVKYSETAQWFRSMVCVYETALYQNVQIQTVTSCETPTEKYALAPDATIRVLMRWTWKAPDWTVIMTAERPVKNDSTGALGVTTAALKAGVEEWFKIVRNWTIQAEWTKVESPTIEVLDSGIDTIRHENIYQYATRLLATAYGKPAAFSTKGMIVQAISLVRRSYKEIFPPYGYLASEKADGKHAVFYSCGNRAFVITGDLYYEFRPRVSGGAWGVAVPPDPTRRRELVVSEVRIDTLQVYEGELIQRETGEFIFVLFDVIYYNDESQLETTGYNRVQYLDAATKFVNTLIATREFCRVNGRSPVTDTAVEETHVLEVRAKQWIELQEPLKDKFESIYFKKYDGYSIDGIIIMGADHNYRDTKIYKWKPAEDNTIDFLAMECPAEVLNSPPNYSKPGFTCYWLFSGTNPVFASKLRLRRISRYEKLFPQFKCDNDAEQPQFYPIQFSPPDDPNAYIFYGPPGLHYQIVELSRVIDESPNPKSTDGMTWKLMRVRADRERDAKAGVGFGNFYRFAEEIWNSIHNPLLFEHLYDFGADYFREEPPPMYKLGRNYNSVVKERLIEKLVRNKDWVVDLASGKGQDLFRYSRVNVENLTTIEMDKDAVEECDYRRLENASKPSRQGSNERMPHITMINADLNDYKEVMRRFSIIRDRRELARKHPQVVVCNFAIHYFVNRLPEFVNLVNSILNWTESGTFICTSFDGAAIHDLFVRNNIENGKAYTFMENGVVKYRLERRYAGNKLANSGQSIGVLLPFSAGEYYEESLVNFKYLNTLFAKYNYTMTHGGSFDPDVVKKEFGVDPPPFVNDMTEVDLAYVKLHSYAVWSRDKLRK